MRFKLWSYELVIGVADQLNLICLATGKGVLRCEWFLSDDSAFEKVVSHHPILNIKFKKVKEPRKFYCKIKDKDEEQYSKELTVSFTGNM